MFCNKCGAKIADKSDYCYKCGNKIPCKIGENSLVRNDNETSKNKPSLSSNNISRHNAIQNREKKVLKNTNIVTRYFKETFEIWKQNNVNVLERLAILLVVAGIVFLINKTTSIDTNNKYISVMHSNNIGNIRNSSNSSNSISNNTNSTSSSSSNSNSSSIDSNTAGNTTASAVPTDNSYSHIGSSFILANSDNTKLSENELTSLDIFQLYIARNEIFARHGYIFKDEQLKIYFQNNTWYHEDGSYHGELNSDIEKYNVNLIKQEEDKREKTLNSDKFITVEQALNSLVTNLKLKVYNQPDLNAIKPVDIYGEPFYEFSLTYFNNEGYEGDSRYVVSQITGNIYRYSSIGSMDSLYQSNEIKTQNTTWITQSQAFDIVKDKINIGTSIFATDGNNEDCSINGKRYYNFITVSKDSNGQLKHIDKHYHFEAGTGKIYEDTTGTYVVENWHLLN